jgi:hypothetical protein
MKMKLINLKSNVVLALVTALAIATSVPAQADEAGFTLEDSIRNQIFLELKANVQELYQNSSLFSPSVDTSYAAKVASNTTNDGFVLPTNVGDNAAVKNSDVEKIN